MDREKLRREILPSMEQVIRFSLRNGLNLHSSVGGKYGELFVVNELWKHNPHVGHSRYQLKNIKNPASSDIYLKKTGTKLEVKWAMLHHREQDYFFRNSGRFRHWGWGFSMGNQFLKRKFDYCVLLAAKEDRALPEHTFVLTCEELNQLMEKRQSGVTTKPSFYIEFSESEEFYHKRRWQPGKLSGIEEKLFFNRATYEERWIELKSKGYLNKADIIQNT